MLFVRPMFILQRPRFSGKLVHYPIVDKCRATVSDAAPTLNHDWLNVSCFSGLVLLHIRSWSTFCFISRGRHCVTVYMLYSSQRDNSLGHRFSWQLVFISDSRSSKLNSEELTRFHDIQVKLVQMVY